MTARERINLLLDRDSFNEYDALVKHQCNDFGMNDNKVISGLYTKFKIRRLLEMVLLLEVAKFMGLMFLFSVKTSQHTEEVYLKCMQQRFAK